MRVIQEKGWPDGWWLLTLHNPTLPWLTSTLHSLLPTHHHSKAAPSVYALLFLIHPKFIFLNVSFSEVDLWRWHIRHTSDELRYPVLFKKNHYALCWMENSLNIESFQWLREVKRPGLGVRFPDGQNMNFLQITLINSYLCLGSVITLTKTWCTYGDINFLSWMFSWQFSSPYWEL